MRTGGLRNGLWAMLLVAGLALGGSVAAQAPDAASPGQDAFSQGLAAAAAQQYPLALEYFTAAQKAEPNRSDVWFNLGLASSKIPGHEFRALGFLQAYLLEVPNSPKRPAIEQLMKQLGIPIEAKLLALLDEHRAMMHAPYGSKQEALAGFRDRAIQSLQAEEAASQQPSVFVYNALTRAFAKSGNVNDALTYLSQYEDYVDKGFSDHTHSFLSGEVRDLESVYRDLIAAYARRNDVKSAAAIYERIKKRARYIQDAQMGNAGANMATDAVSWFACLQQRSGGRTAAAATLRQWLTVIAVPPISQDRTETPTAIQDLAAAQHLSGDPQAAANTLKLVKSRYEFNDMTAPMFPPTFNPLPLSSSATDYRESIDCWTPERRKQKFLTLGLGGFLLWRQDELHFDAGLEDIRQNGKDTLMTQFEILIENMAEAYNELKFRGKG